MPGFFVVGRRRWWLLLIGLCLETIIREADVRHTVDLPRRNWLLWAAGHWYSCAGRQWQTDRTGHSVFEGQRRGGENRRRIWRGWGWVMERRERERARGENEKWQTREKKGGEKRKESRKMGISSAMLSSPHVTSDSNPQKTKCFIGRVGISRYALWIFKSLGLDSYLKKGEEMRKAVACLSFGELSWRILVGFKKNKSQNLLSLLILNRDRTGTSKGIRADADVSQKQCKDAYKSNPSPSPQMTR